eukprot:COSAG03_NODE_5398_length_1259_cov_1.222414_1_plen_58_part_10
MDLCRATVARRCVLSGCVLVVAARVRLGTSAVDGIGTWLRLCRKFLKRRAWRAGGRSR